MVHPAKIRTAKQRLSHRSFEQNVLKWQRRAPLACEASWALTASVFVFQSSSSSPWAFNRDPSSHSSAGLWLFQHLTFLCSTAFLNRQLEHDPNRRTDAIRRANWWWGQSQREEEDCFYCHVPVVDKEECWKAKSAHALNQGLDSQYGAFMQPRIWPHYEQCYPIFVEKWHRCSIVWKWGRQQVYNHKLPQRNVPTPSWVHVCEDTDSCYL